MYSDSPQKQTPPEDFYIDSSHETVQRLHHAYRHDFRYLPHLIYNFLNTIFQNFRLFVTEFRQSRIRDNTRNLQGKKTARNKIEAATRIHFQAFGKGNFQKSVMYFFCI